MTPKAARADIAEKLRAALPSGWAVFGAPPEAPSIPCVVILPRTPYRELLTTTEERMHLRLAIAVPRAVGQASMDLMDDIFDDIKTALDAAASAIDWPAADITGTEEVNGVECLTANVDIDVY